jgi:hypothetical protein
MSYVSALVLSADDPFTGPIILAVGLFIYFPPTIAGY